MDTKTCTDCGGALPLSEFYKGSAKCKPCYRARVKANREANAEHYLEYDRQRANLPHRVKARKEYAETERGQKAASRAKEKWSKRHPLERAAHQFLNNCIRDGKVIKPKNCEKCRKGGRIEGHHEDHTKPLEVLWLCSACHRKLHKRF